MTTEMPPTQQNMSKFSSKRLVPGEKLLWEGRPSIIGYFLRSLMLLILGVLFTSFAYLQAQKDINSGDFGTWWYFLALIILAVAMYLVDRRWGLVEAIVGWVSVVIVFGLGWSSGLLVLPLLVGLSSLGIEYIIWSRTFFAISDRRIMTQTGILSLLFVDTQIDRIQNVTVHQPLHERILGFGDIMFATAGEMGGIKSDNFLAGMKSGGAIVWEDVSKPFEVRKTAENIIFHALRPTVQVVQAPASTVAKPSDAEEALTKLKQMLDKGLITPEEYEVKRKEIIGRM